MWIFTQFGFLSIVRAQERDLNAVYEDLTKTEDEFVIRARIQADLRELMKEVGFARPVLEFKHRDYPYRIFVSADVLQDIMLWTTRTVTYENFKSQVKRRQGHGRAQLYGKVWSVMNDSERKVADLDAEESVYARHEAGDGSAPLTSPTKSAPLMGVRSPATRSKRATSVKTPVNLKS